MRSEDKDKDVASSSDLGSCSKKSSDDVQNNRSEVSEGGFSLLKGLTPCAGDKHKDFRKGDSSVFEEMSILKVLGEPSFLGKKKSASSILGFGRQILS